MHLNTYGVLVFIIIIVIMNSEGLGVVPIP